MNCFMKPNIDKNVIIAYKSISNMMEKRNMHKQQQKKKINHVENLTQKYVCRQDTDEENAQRIGDTFNDYKI